MSMEIYVLSNSQLASSFQWQSAIAAEGFQLVFTEPLSMKELGGMIPCRFRGADTGFECAYLSYADFQAENPESKILPSFSSILVFRWGADLNAGAAASMAAAAYARATGGKVFDGEDGQLLSVDRAVEIAREMDARLPAIKKRLDELLQKMKDSAG